MKKAGCFSRIKKLYRWKSQINLCFAQNGKINLFLSIFNNFFLESFEK